eukprot:GHVR01084016.1.p1 GENE.GHVR01084016.1~~GHVR01084016.1.p1  ORF type:complete len:858 (-),score=101.78 GHVR01084016.1:754-3327(-)
MDLKESDPGVSICRFGKSYSNDHRLHDFHVNNKIGYTLSEEREREVLIEKAKRLYTELMSLVGMTNQLSKVLLLCALPPKDAVALLHPRDWEMPLLMLGSNWVKVAVHLLDAWRFGSVKTAVYEQRDYLNKNFSDSMYQQRSFFNPNSFAPLDPNSRYYDPCERIFSRCPPEHRRKFCREAVKGAVDFVCNSACKLCVVTLDGVEDNDMDLDFAEGSENRGGNVSDNDYMDKLLSLMNICPRQVEPSESDLASPEASTAFLLGELRSAVTQMGRNDTLLSHCRQALRPYLIPSRYGPPQHPRCGETVLNVVSDMLHSSLKPRKIEIMCEAHKVSKNIERIKKAAWLRSAQVDVIGMTSTFAATNTDFVKRLSPTVCIVEEVGELLEAQLIVCLSSSNLQHVVMIGDHKQLRPKVNYYELELKKNFHYSLFERLVKLGHPVATLRTQRRMRPEVSMLVSPFYDILVDHERVKTYPGVLGVGANVYFVSHSINEDCLDSLTASKKNRFEAEYCTRLARYILDQCQYNVEEITLLTPYQGQRMLMMDLLHPRLKGIKVVTIDDYQGEENKVVILSLVRCNSQKRAGFLRIQNRLIVALSRAQHGLFIVGAGEMLSDPDHGGDWSNVLSRLHKANVVGPSLPLGCQIHSTKAAAATAKDFDKMAMHGGCARKCNTLLPTCGHVCPLFCHIFPHDEVKCRQSCVRPRPYGCEHKCTRLCHVCRGKTPDDVCKSECNIITKVSEPLPCTHQPCFPCHKITSKDELRCYFKVTVDLPCGHKKEVKCSEKTKPGKCNEYCMRPRPDGCKHQCKTLCYECGGKTAMRADDVCQSKCDIMTKVYPILNSKRISNFTFLLYFLLLYNE